jgi:hypothetical protein
MINIYITYYIKPEFISLQFKKLNENCIDDFKINVINNGVDELTKDKIRKECQLLDINCIEFDRPSYIPEYCSWSHSQAVDYTIRNYVEKDSKEDITVFMDSDVFSFNKFSFIELLKGNDVAGIHQQRTYDNINYVYLSAIFFIFKNSVDIPNFHFRSGVGDSGSGTYYLIEKYKTCYLNHTATIDIETDYIFTKNSSQYPYKKIFNCQFIDNSLIHYARGSNWCESDVNYHTDKFNFMLNFLENNSEYTINLDDKVLYETAYTSKHYDGVGHNYKNYKFLNNDVSL